MLRDDFISDGIALHHPMSFPRADKPSAYWVNMVITGDAMISTGTTKKVVVQTLVMRQNSVLL